MPIDRFASIRNVGLFKDFTWPGDLKNFAQVNLIYGWNGTGKTTLSRLIYELGNSSKTEDLSLQAYTYDREIKIWVDGDEIEAVDFPSQLYGIKVFNQDFISANILTKDATEPIIYIGDESVKIQQELHTLETKITQHREELQACEQKRDKESEKFESFKSEQAAKIKNDLFDAGSGIKKYQYYTKINYKDKADEIIKNNSQDDENPMSQLSPKELLDEIRKPSKSKVEFFEYSLPDLEAIQNRIATLLQTKVIHKPIERLQNDIYLEEWTKKGLEIYRKSDSNSCPWCEQDLSTQRIKKLDDHFNTFFDQLSLEIELFSKEINSIVDNIPDTKEYYNYDIHSELINDYNNALSELDESIGKIKNWLNQAISHLDTKRANLDKSINLSLKPPFVASEIIQIFNEVIAFHNNKCETRADEIHNLGNEYEKKIIMKESPKFENFERLLESHNTVIDNINSEIVSLNLKTNNLKSKALDVQKPLEELNEDISDFLGHRELQFIKDGSGYKLMRGHNDENQGDTLSEGEKTVIALLYFLKSLEDANFDLSTGIIVLDDPVSSLDSNYLYNAFAKIVAATLNACQIFIFTHNFSLFSEIKRKYDPIRKRHLNSKENKFSAYMLETIKTKENRFATIKSLPEILRNYDSEYYYLFDCLLSVRDIASSSTNFHYNFPNMARRLLEKFLEFRYPGMDTFAAAIDASDFDSSKKFVISRYLNKFSHGDTSSPLGQHDDPFAEAQQVAKYILEMIADLDPNHYSQMLKIIEKTNNSNNKILSDLLRSFSDKPILAAYFIPLNFTPPPGNWAQPELLVIAEVKGDTVQRHEQFSGLINEIEANSINCVIKVYTPKEIENTSIPSRYPNLIA